MKKIFITGASGFIGEALIEKLTSEDWQITGLVRSERRIPDLHQRGVKWVRGDIRDTSWQDFVKDSDILVHLAGVHGYIQIPFRERLAIELEGTKNAITAAKKFNLKHFIHISSAYIDLDTDYALAKKISQNYVMQEIRKGFPATVVCPVTIYGPGKDANFSRLIEAIKRKRFFIIGSGKNYWNLIYITDLINALDLILKHRKLTLSKTYLIGGEAISLRNLVEMIAQESKVKMSNVHLPFVPVFVLGRLFSLATKVGLIVPFTQDTILNLNTSQNYQTSQDLLRLGYQPKISIHAGIKRLLNKD